RSAVTARRLAGGAGGAPSAVHAAAADAVAAAPVAGPPVATSAPTRASGRSGGSGESEGSGAVGGAGVVADGAAAVVARALKGGQSAGDGATGSSLERPRSRARTRPSPLRLPRASHLHVSLMWIPGARTRGSRSGRK